MSLRLQPPPYRAVRLIAPDGTVEYDGSAPSTGALDAFADWQRRILKTLPASALISPLDPALEEELGEEAELGTGMEDAPTGGGAAANAAPAPSYAVKQAEASGRLAAARAEAACLVDLLAMLRQRQLLVPAQLMGLPPPPLQLEDDPALQLRRTRDQIGAAAATLRQGAHGLRSRLESQRVLSSEVAALRSHWRVVSIDSRPSGAWERAYEVSVSLGSLWGSDGSAPGSGLAATSTAQSASLSSKASSAGREEEEGEEEDEPEGSPARSGDTLVRLRCDSGGRLRPLRDASETLVVRFGMGSVLAPLPHHIQEVTAMQAAGGGAAGRWAGVEAAGAAGHGPGERSGLRPEPRGAHPASALRTLAPELTVAPEPNLSAVHGSLLAALSARRSRVALRHLSRAAGRRGVATDAAGAWGAGVSFGAKQNPKQIPSCGEGGGTHEIGLVSGGGVAGGGDQSGGAGDGGAGGGLFLLGIESRRVLLGCAAAPNHVLQVRLDRVRPPVSAAERVPPAVSAPAQPAQRAAAGGGGALGGQPGPSAPAGGGDVDISVPMQVDEPCAVSADPGTAAAFPAVHAVPCLTALDAGLLARLVGLYHTAAPPHGIMPVHPPVPALRAPPSFVLGWLVGAVSFDVSQRRLRRSLDELARGWTEPTLHCEWEYLPPGEASPIPPGCQPATAGPAALVRIGVCLGGQRHREARPAGGGREAAAAGGGGSGSGGDGGGGGGDGGGGDGDGGGGAFGVEASGSGGGSARAPFGCGGTVAVGACLTVTSGPHGCYIYFEPLGGVSSLARTAGAASKPHLDHATPAALLAGLTGEVSAAAVSGLVHSLLGRVMLSALAARATSLQLQAELCLETNQLTVRLPSAVPSLEAGGAHAPGSNGGVALTEAALQQLEGVGQLEQLTLLVRRELGA